VEQFFWELKGILKSYLIRVNNGGTPTSVEGCGNMTSIKQRERRTENSEARVIKSVAGYNTTIHQLKCKRKTIYSQNRCEIIVH
jgi:hypothetical protein